jgi:5'-methylthioadenosine phosphorylase
MSKPRIAVIGGSGLYQMEGLKIQEEREVPTPFGKPSDKFILGDLDGTPVAFLARHARGHRILPGEINFRANLCAIKSLGCEFVVSVSAVGSLKEEIAPGHMVIVDQFIDRTQGRVSTFFGDGLVAHVAFADPTCALLRGVLTEVCKKLGAVFHPQGTYLCIEGPMFSTRAESQLYRSWGADVIGMTNYQEAKLAREAGMSYATLALSTDYDCWHPEHDSVTAEMVIQTLGKNVATAQKILRESVPRIHKLIHSPYANVLKHAIVTDVRSIPEATKNKLKVILSDLVS